MASLTIRHCWRLSLQGLITKSCSSFSTRLLHTPCILTTALEILSPCICPCHEAKILWSMGSVLYLEVGSWEFSKLRKYIQGSIKSKKRTSLGWESLCFKVLFYKIGTIGAGELFQLVIRSPALTYRRRATMDACNDYNQVMHKQIFVVGWPASLAEKVQWETLSQNVKWRRHVPTCVSAPAHTCTHVYITHIRQK